MKEENKEIVLKKIHIRNFKSFKDTEIELKNFNVVIGPNSSGKSNLVELFKLLKDIYTKTYTVNPFLSWWGYQNVVWRKDETLPISITFYFDVYGYDVLFETVFSGQGGQFRFIRENLSINGLLTVERVGRNFVMKYDTVFIDKIWDLYTKALEEFLVDLLISKNELRNAVDKNYFLTPIQVTNFVDESNSLLSFLDKAWIRFYSENLVISFVSVSLMGTEGQKRHVLLISPIIKQGRAHRAEKEPINPRKDVFSEVIRGILNFFSKIVILNPISAQGIKRNIQVARREESLAEDASNLQSVLYNLFLENNQFPERIKATIDYIFPTTEIGFQVTPDARLFIRVYEKNLQLDPPMISDGFYKVLAIMTALEYKASLLLIDEIENSLHPKAIERIIDELKQAEYPVIVTTHSPAVIDIVDPSWIVIIEKDPVEGSKAYRIRNPNKIKTKLTKLGITLSEGWLYGKL